MTAPLPVLPPLCAIVDEERCLHAQLDPVDVADAYLVAGARFLQLRAKLACSATMLEWAERIANRARATGALFVVNDRADIARMVGAGVHVGQDDLSARAARRLVGAEALVGLSSHTLAQVDRALDEPLSYLAIGPVFPTSTKATGYSSVGVAMVEAVAEQVKGRLPLVAIGGITLERAGDVLAAGASCVAVIGDLLSPDPRARCSQWVQALAPRQKGDVSRRI